MIPNVKIYDDLYSLVLPKVKHTVWIFSDLQQADPKNAESCLRISLADVESMGLHPEQIWYLGDAVESADLGHLEDMAKMQKEGFSRLGAPLFYTPGNHDFDYSRSRPGEPPITPFSDAVRSVEGWKTTNSPDDFYFREKLGEYELFFFGDHIAKESSWLSTHGTVRYGEENYPYTDADFIAVREEMASCGKKVITLAHSPFIGGNRENILMSKMLPLPENVRIHFYGHAHIGDWKWAGKNAYRRISWVDYHDIPQIDVASLENIRADFCRSVIFHIYEDDSFGIFFRDHDHRRFTEAYFPSVVNEPHGWRFNKNAEM